MPNQRTNTFRANAKNFFLTYPQCTAPVATAVAFLSGFRPTQYVTVAKELHQDGTPHLHALVCFVDKYNCRNQNAFDITIEGEVFHPNIQVARCLSDVRTYVQKDGEFQESGEFVDSGKRKQVPFSEIIAASDSKEAFMQAVAEHHSRDYVINHERLEYFANKRFKPTAPSYEPRYTNFPNVPDELTDWWRGNFLRPRRDRPQSLVLVGPSRLGKTEWARSLGAHAFCRGGWDAEVFKSFYDYIVFDDFDFSYLFSKSTSLAKAFFGCQGDVTITGKYVKSFTCNTNCPVICLMNPDQFMDHRDFFFSDWGKDNIVVVHLFTPLF